MKISAAFSLLSFVAILAAGCDNSQHGEGRANPPLLKDGPVNVFTAPDSTVLVKVNGEDVTAKDFRDRYGVEEAIYRLKNRNKPVDQLEQGTAVFMGKRKFQILALLVNQRLISGYLAKESQKIADDEAESALNASLRKLAHRGTLGEYAAKLKVDASYLREQLLVPVEEKKAYECFGGGPIVVTEAEIDEGIARQNSYYDRAVASNAVTYVTCSNLYKRIVNERLDFKETGKKYGQYNPEEAEYWERMEASEIENADMKKWAFTAPVGSIGGPFDLGDGLSIVKILERTDGTLEDSAVSLGVADVSLARITFYMLDPEPEPRTREFVRKALYNREMKRRLKKLFEKLHSEMNLEYPYGNNFMFDNGGSK